jgi:hypothetical protein
VRNVSFLTSKIGGKVAARVTFVRVGRQIRAKKNGKIAAHIP